MIRLRSHSINLVLVATVSLKKGSVPQQLADGTEPFFSKSTFFLCSVSFRLPLHLGTFVFGQAAVSKEGLESKRHGRYG
jgi:hypothetical protein